MGSQCSSKAEISALWDKLPEGRQIIITRDRITISDTPFTPAAALEIGSRVVYQDIGDFSTGIEDIVINMNNAQCDDDDSSVGRLSQMPTNGHESSASLHTVEREDMVEVFQEVMNPPRNLDEWKLDDYCALSDQPTSNDPAYASTDSFLHERNPTTYFPTLLDFEEHGMEVSEQNDIDNEAINEVEVLTRTMVDNKDAYTPAMSGSEEVDAEKKDWEEVIKMDSVVREKNCSTPVMTENGQIIQKKIATQFEQKGKRECHVYFTPRTASEIWPHLVVTVDETWPLVKVIRKSLAEIQRAIIKGDREGTHDWVFSYHPNKEIRKIKRELKVLFGRKALVCLGGNLKKNIKDMTSDFIIKIWILQKTSKIKAPKSLPKPAAARRARSTPNTSYITTKVTMKRQGRRQAKKN